MDELKQLEEKKNSLLADIEKYGKDLEFILSAIEEGKNVNIDIEKLKKELADLLIEKNDLLFIQSEITRLEAVKASHSNDLEEIKKLISGMSFKVEEAKVLEGKIESLKLEYSRWEEKLKKTLEARELTESALDNIKREIIDQETYFEGRKELISIDLFQRKSLVEEQIHLVSEKLDSNTKENENIINSIKIHTAELESIKAAKSSLQFELDALDKVYLEKKYQKELEIAGMINTQNERESKISQREGDLSLQESSLERKKTSLLAIKSRLEKESGKSINIEI